VETRENAHILSDIADASMGPRFCERGNQRSALVLGAPGRASMGPRFCKRGNARGGDHAVGDLRLQWGHAFVSVETTRGDRLFLASRRFNGATLL